MSTDRTIGANVVRSAPADADRACHRPICAEQWDRCGRAEPGSHRVGEEVGVTVVDGVEIGEQHGLTPRHRVRQRDVVGEHETFVALRDLDRQCGGVHDVEVASVRVDDGDVGECGGERVSARGRDHSRDLFDRADCAQLLRELGELRRTTHQHLPAIHLFAEVASRVVGDRERSPQLQVARRRRGERLQQGDVLTRPLACHSIDRTERPDDVSVGRSKRNPGPRDDAHRLEQRVLRTADVEPSVVDRDRPVGGDDVLTEGVADRVLPVQPGVHVGLDSHCADPERPLLVDEGHEDPGDAEHRSGETCQLIERVVRRGIEQMRCLDRCESIPIEDTRLHTLLPRCAVPRRISAPRPVPLHEATLEPRRDERHSRDSDGAAIVRPTTSPRRPGTSSVAVRPSRQELGDRRRLRHAVEVRHVHRERRPAELECDLQTRAAGPGQPPTGALRHECQRRR